MYIIHTKHKNQSNFCCALIWPVRETSYPPTTEVASKAGVIGPQKPSPIKQNHGFLSKNTFFVAKDYWKCNIPMSPNARCWLVGRSLGWSVKISFKVRQVTLLFSYLSITIHSLCLNFEMDINILVIQVALQQRFINLSDQR